MVSVFARLADIAYQVRGDDALLKQALGAIRVAADDVMEPSGVTSTAPKDVKPGAVVTANKDVVQALVAEAGVKSDLATSMRTLPISMATLLKHLDAVIDSVSTAAEEADETDESKGKLKETNLALQKVRSDFLQYESLVQQLADIVTDAKDATQSGPSFPTLPRNVLPSPNGVVTKAPSVTAPSKDVSSGESTESVMDDLTALLGS